MTPNPKSPAELTEAQRTGRRARDADQDRTLVAMHQLEAALAAAAPGRKAPWRRDVVAALAVLDEATTEEQANADRADSLLSDIKRTQPRLRSRVNGVRAQYRHLRRTLASLREELANTDETDPDIADIRQRLAWLLMALRHQRARESDLIYDAYRETFNTDLDHDTP